MGSKAFATVNIIAISFLLLPTSPVQAGYYEGWHSYTSTSEVRYIDYFNDTLQVITAGGWLKIDPRTLGMKKITNIDGPETNDLYYILKDSSSAIWLAGYGRLVKYFENQYTPYLFFDRDGNLLTLYSIADDGEWLWVATSSGLILFSKNIDGGQIQDSYSRFGNLSAEPTINDVLVLGDTIWVATSAGLAVADKSIPNRLKSFASWNTFDTFKLPAVNTVAYFHNKIYIGTDANVFRLDISPTDTSFVRIPIRPNENAKHIIVNGDSLVIYATGGFFIYTDPGMEWSYTPTLPSNSFSAGRFVDGVHWIGHQANGLSYGANNNFTHYNDGGMPGNYVSSLSSSDNGRIAGCFRSSGFAVLDNNGWQKAGINTGEWATATLQDEENNIWVGTWGNGLFFINDDSTVNFNEQNSTLKGVLGSSTYVVVNCLTTSSNYLFAGCYGASNGNSVSVVDRRDKTRWISFGAADGITTGGILSIDCFNGSFAIGTENNGVFYYYFGSNPFDISDDTVVNLKEDNSYLASNTVYTVKFDKEGILWAGTKYGLSRYDPGIERFVTVNLPEGFGPDVMRLVFDPRGNIWMGAGNGLTRYDAGTGSITIYNILNSGLVDNHVYALMIHPITNDLWVGTSGGMSRLESSIGQPTTNIVRVIAFPNPFIIRNGDEGLSFNYNGEAIVRIYNTAGELVREMSINTSWNGKNQKGYDVASGVYLFLLTASDGSIGHGKILLIR